MLFNRRMCAFKNTPISIVDRASVQLTFVKLDSDGRSTGDNIILDCCGDIRRRGLVDDLIGDKLKEIDSQDIE